MVNLLRMHHKLPGRKMKMAALKMTNLLILSALMRDSKMDKCLTKTMDLRLLDIPVLIRSECS